MNSEVALKRLLAMLRDLTKSGLAGVPLEEVSRTLASIFPTSAEMINAERTAPLQVHTKPPTRVHSESTSSTPRLKNLKHKKLSSFYKKVREGREKDIAIVDVEEASRTKEKTKEFLLASLRDQLTAAVVQDRQLVQKANSLPIFRPRKRAKHTKIRQFYRQSAGSSVTSPPPVSPGRGEVFLVVDGVTFSLLGVL